MIEVNHGSTTDYILLSDANGSVTLSEGELTGDVGFVRERKGKPIAMALWGGTRLRWSDTEVTASGIQEARVEKVSRRAEGDDANTLTVSEPFPEGTDLKGAVAIIEFGDGTTRGCRVRSVDREGDRCRVVLQDDPGFTVTPDGAQQRFFPHREIPGPVVCRIRGSVILNVAKGELHSVGAADFHKE